VAADNEAARYLSLLEGRVSRQGSGRRPASSRRLGFLCRLDPSPAVRSSSAAAHGPVDVGAAVAAFALDRLERPFRLRAVSELAQ